MWKLLFVILVFSTNIHARDIPSETFNKGTGYYDLIHYEWLSIQSRVELYVVKMGGRVQEAVFLYYKNTKEGGASVNVIYPLTGDYIDAKAVVEVTLNLDGSFELRSRSGYYF